MMKIFCSTEKKIDLDVNEKNISIILRIYFVNFIIGRYHDILFNLKISIVQFASFLLQHLYAKNVLLIIK